jgi:hypothetical protein
VERVFAAWPKLGVDWALAEVVLDVTGLAEVSGLLNNPGMGGTAPGGS